MFLDAFTVLACGGLILMKSTERGFSPTKYFYLNGTLCSEGPKGRFSA